MLFQELPRVKLAFDFAVIKLLFKQKTLKVILVYSIQYGPSVIVAGGQIVISVLQIVNI